MWNRGLCDRRLHRLRGGTLYNVCTPIDAPTTLDGTCDGVDDDCDGQADEDYVGYPVRKRGLHRIGNEPMCGWGRCGPMHAWGACPHDATCDGVDDDCDGEVDEDYPEQPTTCGAGICLSGESSPAWVGVCKIPAFPGNPEELCDGLDNNCDGDIDEGYVGASVMCGFGPCEQEGVYVCNGESRYPIARPRPGICQRPSLRWSGQRLRWGDRRRLWGRRHPK